MVLMPVRRPSLLRSRYTVTSTPVVGTPGSGFGPAGEGYMRLTAFNTADNTREALERVLAVL